MKVLSIRCYFFILSSLRKEHMLYDYFTFLIEHFGKYVKAFIMSLMEVEFVLVNASLPLPFCLCFKSLHLLYDYFSPFWSNEHKNKYIYLRDHHYHSKNFTIPVSSSAVLSLNEIFLFHLILQLNSVLSIFTNYIHLH